MVFTIIPLRQMSAVVGVDPFPGPMLKLADHGCPFSPASKSGMQMGKGTEVENPEYIQEPNDHHNDNDAIQDRLNARLHRDEAVHQPEQDPYDDQRDENLHQWHTLFSYR
jgi:hypothetical protein